MLIRDFLASTCFAPNGVEGGGDGAAGIPAEKPVDDLSDDVLAAYEELEGSDGGDTEKLGDGRAETREQARETARDGKQAKAAKDETDRPSHRDDRGSQRVAERVRRDDKGVKAGGEPGGAPASQPEAPPPSFSPASKAAWNAFRESFPAIAADIAKRETETAQGLAALRDYKDIAPYAKMAAESGTTLSNALLRYTNLENLARQNPVNGVIAVCQGLRLEQADAAQVLLRAAQLLGARVGPSDRNVGQDAGEGGADRNAAADPFVRAIQPLFRPMLDRMVQLEERLGGFAQADRNARERSLDTAIDSFARDPANVYFPDVEEQITQLFETGMVPLTGNHAADLKAAYDVAIRMHPQVSEALIEQRLAERGGQRRSREQEIADRARRASRSLAGSQAADLDHERPKKRDFKSGQKPTDDIADDVAAAYDQLAGNAAY